MPSIETTSPVAASQAKRQNIIRVIAVLYALSLLVNAFLFIPQARDILRHHDSSNVSLTTFVSFWILILIAVVYGAATHDNITTFCYALSLITCGIVVILIVKYKKKKRTYQRL